uniref:Uncharacterized protein n=1 Tax=Anguilla anguilla TaxID=7936 RepID=A0A0E9P5R3_ANGAN
MTAYMSVCNRGITRILQSTLSAWENKGEKIHTDHTHCIWQARPK